MTTKTFTRVFSFVLSLACVSITSPAWAYVFGDPIVADAGSLAFDFNLRVRAESRANTFDFNSAATAVTDDTFVLSRARIGVKYTVTPKLSFYVQGQDSREFDSTRDNVPFVNAAEGNDPFDLRLCYADIGDARDDALCVRIGRQILAYGDERLIGGFEWNNFARTFDAIKFTFNAASIKTTVDCFAANVVTIEGRNHGTKNDFQFDNSDPHDLFSGVYVQNSGAVKNQKTDLYLLYRDKDRNGPIYRPNTLTSGATGVAPYDIPEKIWTLGFRLQSISSAALKGFDYIVEGAYQWGKSRPGLTPAIWVVPDWYDHSAYALHAETGYTYEGTPYLPRLSVEFNVASGDKNPGDKKNTAFLNLFPTNHKFYGYMDVLAWKNMRDSAVTLRFKPLAAVSGSLKKSVLRLDYHWFALATTEDLWYRANAITSVVAPAAAIRGALPKDLGQETDLTWTWSPSPPYELLLGYSYFDAGAYLPAARTTTTVTGRAENARFAYAQLVVKF